MFINQKNPHGGDIYSNKVKYDFSSNINPAGMPQEIVSAIQNSAENSWRYPDPYCRELVKQISEHESVPQDHILCGNGAAELIYSFAYCLPLDRSVMIVSPTFSEYETAIFAAGIKADHYLLKEENGFRLTNDILKEELSRFSAVFLCTPNNPTGISVGRELVYALAKTGVPLFIDMCFLDLTEDPDKYDVPALVEKNPNVTVLKAFTKSYAMAGIRLGYIMSSNEALLKKMSTKMQCWNVSYLAQQAGIAALGCGDWLERSVHFVTEQRVRLMEGLRRYGIKVWSGEANYLMLYSEKDFYADLKERGFLIRDCSNYPGLGKGYYRIAVRTEKENEALLEAFSKMFE
ncbi:MAG: aminotransferase class I/II-fold pyridoxal phosphate-dependent enzyme [Oscillospiraceae bacterium]|nr:aminotransferase class I/II-fold pyridoxal phosphate-dependent enzyme [Oscillospiraceae bacterium]